MECASKMSVFASFCTDFEEKLARMKNSNLIYDRLLSEQVIWNFC
jgi:hypothetical protein